MAAPSSEIRRTVFRKRRIVTVTFWNQWIKPRVEHYADGSSTLFFGVGKATWHKKVIAR